MMELEENQKGKLTDKIIQGIKVGKYFYERKIAILRELQKKGLDLSTVNSVYKSENGDNVGKWIMYWRKDYKKGKLTEEQVEELTELGIDLSLQHKTYEEKLVILREMQEQGMDLSTIPTTFKSENGDNVGSWIQYWGKVYRKGRLPKEQVEELAELGIDLSLKCKTYEEKLAILREMQQQGIDLSNIEALYQSKEGYNVGTWISNFRQLYKKGKLPDEQVEELTGLGIRLDPINKVLPFEEKLAIFTDLQEQGIDLSNIEALYQSKEGYNVGTWITHFRQLYKKGKLPDEQVEKLTELGIDLSLQRKTYEEKIAVLREMQEQGMDLSTIPKRFKLEDGDNVGRWLNQWRTAYREGRLPEEQVEGLTELGIRLDPSRRMISEEEKIAILREMQERGMDLSIIPTTFKSENGDNVGNWINRWRKLYRKGKLPEEQAEELTGLGIRLGLMDRKKDKQKAKKKLEDAVKLYNEYGQLTNDQYKDI